jgi:hypothetical protein
MGLISRTMENIIPHLSLREKYLVIILGCFFAGSQGPGIASGNLPAGVQIFTSEQSSPLFADCGKTIAGNLGESTLRGLTANQSANQVLTDNDTGTKIAGKAVFELSFGNRTLLNGPGPDLLVYETDNPEPFRISVFDPTRNNYTSTAQFVPRPTGTNNNICQTNVNSVAIDLDAFGIAENTEVSLIYVDNLGESTSFSGSDIADILAIEHPSAGNSSAVLTQNLSMASLPLCLWLYNCT